MAENVAPSDSRFSPGTAKEFWELRQHLWEFGQRLSHLRSVEVELKKVVGKKTFDVRHPPMWSMLLSERDMLIIELASWAKGLYGKCGFFKRLDGRDLKALGCRSAYKSEREAFNRLFPDAKSDAPCMEDLRALDGRLAKRFEPLLLDRHVNRAHKYERDGKQRTAAMLEFDELSQHLQTCHQIVSDIGGLTTDLDFSAQSPVGEVLDDDDEAKDVVDLILCGTIPWILAYGTNVTRNADDRSYWQRRKTYYERLHGQHDASGEPDKPFNRSAVLQGE